MEHWRQPVGVPARLVCGAMVVLAGMLGGPAGAETFRDPRFYLLYSHTCLPFDWDRDGWPDLLVAPYIPDSIFVLLNDHEGTFVRHLSIQTPPFPSMMAAADLNGDGHQDLIVGSLNRGDIAVYLSSATGLEPPTRYDTGVSVTALETLDFDGDGDLDLVATEGAPRATVDRFRNNGDGSFTDIGWINVGGGLGDIDAGDVNEDGHMDLAVANGGVNEMLILLGDGTGGFTQTTFPSLGGQVSVRLADLDGDGHLDMVLAGAGTGKIVVYVGVGDGTFTSPVTYTVGRDLIQLVVGDVDQDGDLDLVIGSRARLEIWMNDGSGGLARSDVLAPGYNPEEPVLADFDRNGFPDLAVCLLNDSVAVYLSASGPVTPTLVSATTQDYRHGRLVLTWQSSSSLLARSAVYRRREDVWARLGEAVRGTDGRSVWEDANVEPGATYHYRLGVMVDRREVHVGEVVVTIPLPASFGLALAGPNPAAREVQVRVTLGTDAPARLTVWDVGGRRVADQEVGRLGAGLHTLDAAGGRRLAPGVYEVRLSQAGRVVSRRAIIAR